MKLALVFLVDFSAQWQNMIDKKRSGPFNGKLPMLLISTVFPIMSLYYVFLDMNEP